MNFTEFTFDNENGMYAIIPESVYNIVSDSELLNNNLIFESTLLLLSLFNSHKYYVKTNRFKNHAFSYHNTLLSTIYGKTYLKYIDELIRLGLINKKDSYSPKKYSKKYKLHDNFYNKICQIYEIKSSKVRKKFKKLLKNSHFVDNSGKYIYLKSQYETIQNISIDHDSVKEWMNSSDIFPSSNSKEKYYIHTIFFFSQHKITRFKVSPTNNRLNSIMTTLPKHLRKFIYFNNKNGEKIFKKVEIDGSNTQPILICMFLEKLGYNIEKEFKELCLNGSIYDVIANGTNTDRTQVKRRFMDTLLYTKDNGMCYLASKNLKENDIPKKVFVIYFKNKFPDFYNSLLTIKRNLSKGHQSEVKYKKFTSDLENEYKSKKELKIVTNTRKKGKKRVKKNNFGGSKLAIIIQKMESDLWIHTLLKNLPKALNYFTIHDSIMIFSPTVEQVQTIICSFNKICEEKYGCRFPLKINFLNYSSESELNEKEKIQAEFEAIQKQNST